MTFRKHTVLFAAALAAFSLQAPLHAQMTAAPPVAADTLAPGLVPKASVAPLVPPAVFFAGKVASTQVRNAGAAKLPGDHYIVSVLVDTSGYSTSVQEKYQAYLITEATLTIDGHSLPAGAYGCGFIANDTFIVMDIGGATLFTAHSTRDAELRRPTPLQMLASPDGNGYRLYVGRSYVTLQAAK
jgi:hypothetical protein